MAKHAAAYWVSAPDVKTLPHHPQPEVALAGRSNVGKSSLLGMLLGQPSLVRVSRTPGRTQMLNAFTYGEQLVYVDLPGYGYAKLSHKERDRMGAMVQGYLTKRQELRGVLLLLDARRDEVSPLDRQVADEIMDAGRPLLLVVTKSDLLAKNVRLATIRRLEKSFGVQPGWSVACSSKTGEGKAELVARVRELCAG